MPKKTTQYALNQWEPEDDFLRTDFNEDNAKLEAALAGLQSGLDALDAAVDSGLEGLRGNTDSALQALETRLNSSISSVQTAANNAVSAAETRLNSTIDSTKTALNNSISSVQTSLTNSINSVKGSVTSLQTTVSSLNTTVANLQTALNNAKPVFGTYTGSYAYNVATKTAITLGFRPKMVFILNYNGKAITSSEVYMGLVYDGCTNGTGITITDTGFTVHNASTGVYSLMNYSGMTYHYVALRP